MRWLQVKTCCFLVDFLSLNQTTITYVIGTKGDVCCKKGDCNSIRACSLNVEYLYGHYMRQTIYFSTDVNKQVLRCSPSSASPQPERYYTTLINAQYKKRRKKKKFTNLTAEKTWCKLRAWWSRCVHRLVSLQDRQQCTKSCEKIFF